MDTEVAPVVVQLRVAEPPGAMAAGTALKVAAGGAIVTVTVALAVALPLPFFTVIVYFVVLVGVTTTEPFTGTAPILLLMEAEVAPVEVQVRVEDQPTTMLAGEAEIVTFGLAAQFFKVKFSNTIVPTSIMIIFLDMLILQLLTIGRFRACFQKCYCSLPTDHIFARYFPSNFGAISNKKCVKPIGTMVSRVIVSFNGSSIWLQLSQYGTVQVLVL